MKWLERTTIMLAALVLAMWTAPAMAGDPVGACCVGEGECQEMTWEDCELASGYYHGDGTTCQTLETPCHHGPCCCLPGVGGNNCDVVTQEACDDVFGAWSGYWWQQSDPQNPCSEISCDCVNACCLSPGCESGISFDYCTKVLDGNPLLPFESCSDCPQGACCLPDGGCYETDDSFQCEDSDGGTFEPNRICPPPDGFVFTVPGDYASISEAIADITSGQTGPVSCNAPATILVMPGIYTDIPLSMPGNYRADLHIKSAQGPAVTILAGWQLDPQQRIMDLPAPSVTPGELIIEGFSFMLSEAEVGGAALRISRDVTIRDCWFFENRANSGDDPDSGLGGAVLVASGMPVFDNCWFQANDAATAGGAVAVKPQARAQFHDCMFEANRALTGVGGGLHIASTGAVNPIIHVIGCEFHGNQAQKGGGVFRGGTASFVVQSSVFADNSVVSDGAGLFNESTTKLEVLDSSFTSNIAVRHGGGIATAFETDALIKNCTFTSNMAARGGGVYGDLESQPRIEDCVFTQNNAMNRGGGVYVTFLTEAVIIGSTFTANMANDGGAIVNAFGSHTVITESTFTQNAASGNGGAIYNSHFSNPSVQDCTFETNSATQRGGAVYFDSSGGSFVNCTFQSNTAIERGGAIHAVDGFELTVSDSTFSSNNVALGVGGAVAMVRGEFITFDDCEFTGNTAGSGGAMHTEDAELDVLVIHSAFSNNMAVALPGNVAMGGAIMSAGGVPWFVACTFSGNSAADAGGAVANTGNADPTFVNCLFTDNASSSGQGGAIAVASDNASIINCTIADNNAASGGGVHVSGSAVIFNTIAWDNSGNDVVFDQALASGSLTFSNVGSAVNAPDGSSFISSDPLFVDAAAGDYRLTENSPSIDAGSNNAIPEGIDEDLDGNPRIVDGNGDGQSVVDMGAYEFNPDSGSPAKLGDLNADGVVDVSDLLILLGQWGQCADCGNCPADLNDDCAVDVSDLLILLGNWG